MPMYRLAFWLLIIMPALMHNYVDAGWVAIDQQYQSPGLQTVYIDRDTMLREGGLVTLSALIEWTWMQGNRSPTRFYSTKMTKQFDCAEKRVRTLAATDFYGHMGTGEPIGGGGHTNEGHWVAIEPETSIRAYGRRPAGKNRNKNYVSLGVRTYRYRLRNEGRLCPLISNLRR